MGREPEVLNLVCPHTPHTSMVRVKCQPPVVIYTSCEECAGKFLEACTKLGGEIIKPENLM